MANSDINEEKNVVDGIKAGNRDAFTSLFDTYKDRVFNTALGMVHDKQDADEVTQEVFITVFRSISDFKGESKLSTWIYRITVTKSLDLLRSRNRRKRLSLVAGVLGLENFFKTELTPDFEHPGLVLEKKEQNIALFKAIGRLPETQKTAFVLHKIEGLPYQEISEIMKTTIPGVESLIHRARVGLKKTLSKTLPV